MHGSSRKPDESSRNSLSSPAQSALRNQSVWDELIQSLKEAEIRVMGVGVAIMPQHPFPLGWLQAGRIEFPGYSLDSVDDLPTLLASFEYDFHSFSGKDISSSQGTSRPTQHLARYFGTTPDSGSTFKRDTILKSRSAPWAERYIAKWPRIPREICRSAQVSSPSQTTNRLAALKGDPMNLKVVLHLARKGGCWAKAPRCPRLRHVPATQWGTTQIHEYPAADRDGPGSCLLGSLIQ